MQRVPTHLQHALPYMNNCCYNTTVIIPLLDIHILYIYIDTEVYWFAIHTDEQFEIK